MSSGFVYQTTPVLHFYLQSNWCCYLVLKTKLILSITYSHHSGNKCQINSPNILHQKLSIMFTDDLLRHCFIYLEKINEQNRYLHFSKTHRRHICISSSTLISKSISESFCLSLSSIMHIVHTPTTSLNPVPTTLVQATHFPGKFNNLIVFFLSLFLCIFISL